MPKFRNKPKVITAVQIREDNRDEWPPSVSVGMIGDLAVENGLHGSRIGFKYGDYVRIDDPNDNYPIDAAYMAANYDELIEINDHQ